MAPIFAELEASTIVFSLLVFALFTLTGMLNETDSELLTNEAPDKGKIVLLGDIKECEMCYFNSSCIAASSSQHGLLLEVSRLLGIFVQNSRHRLNIMIDNINL